MRICISVAATSEGYRACDRLSNGGAPGDGGCRAVACVVGLEGDAVAIRDNPYGAFNFLVRFGDGAEDQVSGGFSDVSGLGNEVQYAEYRNGNDPQNHVRKIATTNTTQDVVLRRGLIGYSRLFDWLKSTREGRSDRRKVTIVLLDEARVPVCEFVLHEAQPKKWVGPTLAAKGGGEVAMEELHLVAEQIDFVSL
jgi:phage tail-like protein